MLVKKGRVGLLLVLVAVLGFGLVVAAEDGSAAWPTTATQPSTLDFSEVVGGAIFYPGEVTPLWVDWGCYRICMAGWFGTCHVSCFKFNIVSIKGQKAYATCMTACLKPAPAACLAICW